VVVAEWNHLRWKAENLPDTLTMLRDQLRLFFEAVIGSQKIGGRTNDQ